MLAQTTGLFFNDAGSQDGYVLFSPNTTTTTYLMDKAGNIVNQWTVAVRPGIDQLPAAQRQLAARRLAEWPRRQRLHQRGRRRRTVGRIRLERQPDLAIRLRQSHISGPSRLPSAAQWRHSPGRLGIEEPGRGHGCRPQPRPARAGLPVSGQHRRNQARYPPWHRHDRVAVARLGPPRAGLRPHEEPTTTVRRACRIIPS